MGLVLNDLKQCAALGAEYMTAFESYVGERLKTSLLSVIESHKRWAVDGDGVGLPGVDLSEMLHHCSFAKEKCSSFIGRLTLIDQVMALIETPHREVEEELDPLNPVHRFLGVCAAVVGVSGAGKTALMAKVASEVFSRQPESVVIVRFCGTSPKSATAFQLMVSLCDQIEYLFKLHK